MPSTTRRSLSGLTGLTVGVVLGATLVGGTAYAATGGTFVLGRANSAGATTTLKNTATTATLTLPAARTGQPPLAVSSNSGKVPHLNVDKLDGLDSSAFALAGGRVGRYSVSGEAVDLDEDGTLDGVYAGVNCPTGTKLVGGGSETFAVGAHTLVDGPDANGWDVLVSGSTAATDVAAHALCWNPRGGSPAGADQSHLQAGLRATLSDEHRARAAKALAHAG